jgi:hypothetical protein
MTQQAYCRNCGQFVAPTKGLSWFWFLILTPMFILPGLIYFWLRAGKGGKCPICGGKNWGKPE